MGSGPVVDNPVQLCLVIVHTGVSKRYGCCGIFSVREHMKPPEVKAHTKIFGTSVESS